MNRFERNLLGFCLGVLLILFLAAALVSSAEAQTRGPVKPDTEQYLVFSHLSDFFRGPPLFDDDYEPTTDFIGWGLVMGWSKVDLNLEIGAKARDCNYVKSSEEEGDCDWETGTKLEVRWYFLRGRRGR